MIDNIYKRIVLNAIAAPRRKTRNAVTNSYFGEHLVIDSLEHGRFPILLGRKMYYEGVLGELAAFLKGPKHIKDFEKEGCNYWKTWADEDGVIEVDYGNAWLDYNGTNQLEEVVSSLKKDPFGRRHIIDAWRPDHLSTLSLPCCHYSYQWYVTNSGYLEMVWNQRSVDLMVGLPSDIILCAAWNILMAQTVGLKPGKLHLMLGDCHIYEAHKDGLLQYLLQTEDLIGRQAPIYSVAPDATVFNFSADMLELVGYDPKGPIKFKLLA